MVFTPSANLLLAIMHHGGKDPFIKLKQVFDIACLINRNKNIDWEWLIPLAKKYNVEDLIYVTVNVASELTGFFVDEPLRKKIRSFKIQSLSKNRIRSMAKKPSEQNSTWSGLNDWLFRIRSRTGLKRKMVLFFYISRIFLNSKFQ
jgi:hypothetical protein